MNGFSWILPLSYLWNKVIMKVIIYNIFGLGHINPTLPLVRSLVAKGVQVIYHTSPERKALIESTGAEWRNYGRDDYKAADYNPGKNFVLQTLPAAMGLYPILSEELEKEKPDLILYDSMAPWGRILAHTHRIPSVCLVTTMALSLIEKRKMLMSNAVVIDDLNIEILKKLKNDFQLDLDFECVLGTYHDCNIVFSSKNVNPPLDELKSSHFHFVGGATGLETLQLLHSILPDDKKRKVITMALGTIIPFEDPSVIEWYKTVIRTFSSDRRFHLIVAIPNDEIRLKVGPLSPQVRVVQRIPQQEVLKHTSVFIHHGGMNSVSEGIAAGVPMLVIPHSYDQFTNAARVVELEAGHMIRREELTEQNVREKVLDLMFSPKIQSKICRLKDETNQIIRAIDPASIILERISC